MNQNNVELVSAFMHLGLNKSRKNINNVNVKLSNFQYMYVYYCYPWLNKAELYMKGNIYSNSISAEHDLVVRARSLRPSRLV
jgi:hypothetical protein